MESVPVYCRYGISFIFLDVTNKRQCPDNNLLEETQGQALKFENICEKRGNVC